MQELQAEARLAAPSAAEPLEALVAALLVREEPGVPAQEALVEYLWQMLVRMRVASPNLIAVLSVWALLTPSRVLPAKFSITARRALAFTTLHLAPCASGWATAGAIRDAGKETPVLVVSSVR